MDADTNVFEPICCAFRVNEMGPALLQPATNDFQRVHRLNIAAAVALRTAGELSNEAFDASYIGLREVAHRYCENGAHWSEVGDYLEIEKLMVESGGLAITELHSGRSRQDIVATVLRMAWRQHVIDSVQASVKLRRELHALACLHLHAVLPAYTWGVQAQPTSLGHYLLGYSSALLRWQKRMVQTYDRVNESPLGSCVLGTSLFSLDRNLLASLLGFSGPIVNSFDAVQLAPVDMSAEVAGQINMLASGLSLLYADVTAQYHHIEPWLVLNDDKVGSSSAMPQKRNPVVVSGLRRQNNGLLGLTSAILLNCHNISSGMHDYKHHDVTVALERTANLLDNTADMVSSLIFIPAVSKAETDRDYASATDLANVLQTLGVPLRAAHACVARLVVIARAKRIKLAQIDGEQVRCVFQEHLPEGQSRSLAVRWDKIKDGLSAEWVLRNRKGLGGPQPESVEAMLLDDAEGIASMEGWAMRSGEALAAADESLCVSFYRLARERVK